MAVIKLKTLIMLFCLAFAGFFNVRAVMAEETTVRILAVHFPPYEIENPADDRRGFDVEVVEAAFTEIGMQAKFEFMPWNRAKKTVEDGKATALLSCSYRPERDEFYLFSDTISHSTRGFYVLADYQGPAVLGFEDLLKAEFDEYVVGVVHGYSPEKRLKKLGVKYDPAPNDVSAIKKLLMGRTDFFLSTRESVAYLLKEIDSQKPVKFFQSIGRNFVFVLVKNGRALKSF